MSDEVDKISFCDESSNYLSEESDRLQPFHNPVEEIKKEREENRVIVN